MQAGIFKVCLVLLTAIVNHPLLFPNEDIDLPVSDELIIQKIKVYEEKLKFNQLQLEQLLSHAETKKNAETEITEDDPPWHFWSAMPMIILLIIEIWRQVFQDGNSPEQSKEEKDLQFLRNSCQSVALPNNLALAIFSDQYFRLDTYDATRTREFVEDFAEHLLETLRSVCNRDADMEVKDSICVGSMYENWRVNKPFVCDLIVPFVPPEPYHFRCQSWVTNNCIPPGCGIIRVAGPDDESVGCVCDKTKLGEDMFCLLHNPKNKTKVNNEVDLLCSKTTHSLDTDQVMKWFQTAVTKFWTKVSHIYNFDLSFSHLECPGALRVKCKSGKVINFNITPVVQYEDSDLYFLSHLPRSTIPGVSSNIHWFLSFAVYERRFLKDIAKSLPEDSCHLCCLQIMTFLHSKQCHITGQSGLTSYHLKTVLLHLLLTRSSSDWDNMMLEERLHDMFKSLEKCLLEKRMHHFMVGNSKLPESVNLPDHFRLAEPLNLFRPFVLNRELYQKTLFMFYEMLKNATLLINEYILNFRPAHANKNHINITTV